MCQAARPCPNRKGTGLFISELGTGGGRPGSNVAAGVFLARAWQRILYHGVGYCRGRHAQELPTVKVSPRATITYDFEDWEVLLLRMKPLE